MAQAHGAWGGKPTPAVVATVEKGDPQSFASTSSRVAETPAPPAQPTCSHCYKRFKTVEQLETHVVQAKHSTHDPKCGACGKHFANLDTLRQHIMGQLPNKACAARFRVSGCAKCLAIGEAKEAPHEKNGGCPFEIERNAGSGNDRSKHRRAVALDCEMLGDELDGGGAMCARVCVVDEFANVLLSTFVKLERPVTDYRTHVTGIDCENAPLLFASAKSLAETKRMVLSVLHLSETEGDSCKATTSGPLLIGHDLSHDLQCLGIDHLVPESQKRDTARYPVFQRHTHHPYKLRVLAMELLGVRIQSHEHAHDPKEDAVASMRLYLGGRALCGVYHGKQAEGDGVEKVKKTESRFICWCLDCEPGTETTSHHPASSVLSPKRGVSPHRKQTTRSPHKRSGAFALRDSTNVE